MAPIINCFFSPPSWYVSLIFRLISPNQNVFFYVNSWPMMRLINNVCKDCTFSDFFKQKTFTGIDTLRFLHVYFHHAVNCLGILMFINRHTAIANPLNYHKVSNVLVQGHSGDLQIELTVFFVIFMSWKRGYRAPKFNIVFTALGKDPTAIHSCCSRNSSRAVLSLLHLSYIHSL